MQCELWHPWLHIYSIRKILFPTWACFSCKTLKLVLDVVSSINSWYKQAMLHFLPKEHVGSNGRAVLFKNEEGHEAGIPHTVGNGFVGFVWQRNSQVINYPAFRASWAGREGHRESRWTLVCPRALVSFPCVELRKGDVQGHRIRAANAPDNPFHSQEIVSCVTKPLQILLASSGKYFWVQPHTVACKFCYSVLVGNILWVIYV